MGFGVLGGLRGFEGLGLAFGVLGGVWGLGFGG